MVELMELPKKEFDKVMEILELKNLKCSVCGDKITKENFGLIHADVIYCKSLLCIIGKSLKRSSPKKIPKR